VRCDVGHLEIADHVNISAATLVTQSILRAGTYAGVYPIAENKDWARSAAHLRNLDKLVDRVRKLEKQISDLQKRKRR
jgi:UDP-3-O-[3-hydroxymyristoyl] glucosamine N-acyltransferase